MHRDTLAPVARMSEAKSGPARRGAAHADRHCKGPPPASGRGSAIWHRRGAIRLARTSIHLHWPGV